MEPDGGSIVNIPRVVKPCVLSKKARRTDWTENPIYNADPNTGEATRINIFIGVMSYSQYALVEGFTNEKELAWITANFVCSILLLVLI